VRGRSAQHAAFCSAVRVTRCGVVWHPSAVAGGIFSCIMSVCEHFAWCMHAGCKRGPAVSLVLELWIWQHRCTVMLQAVQLHVCIVTPCPCTRLSRNFYQSNASGLLSQNRRVPDQDVNSGVSISSKS
jgi:hypothetical protein